MVRRTGSGLTGPSRLLSRPLPAPPDRLRIGPFHPDAFTSPLRSERLTAQLGLALGPAFAICFATGLISHLIQHPAWWFEWPARPVSLYRITQGLHVATGLACIPLLLAKLWSAYPRLFTWPPVRDLRHALERASIAVLVTGAVFQLVTGLVNIARWYPVLPFFFTVAHYWTAWITIGALTVHIGVKLPVIRQALTRRPKATDPSPEAAPEPDTTTLVPGQRPEPDPGPGAGPDTKGGDPGPATGAEAQRSRRGFLAAVGAATGLVTLVTVGQTVRPLAGLDLLAPRRPDIGPQGLPVNKSAVEAGVGTAARDPGYRLSVDGPRPFTLGLAQLRALPQYTVELPIACVEGWSATAHWTGVRLRDLLDRAGAPPDARLRVESLQHGGLYRTATLNAAHCRDPLALLALRIGGAELDLDHGYPCRLIAPNLPGVMQTKWVSHLVVLP